MLKVLKIDIDYKPPREWIDKWELTRTIILRYLGYNPVKYIYRETDRGIHIYIHLDKPVEDETANMLQFLLGDDHTRVKINQWRIERGVKRWNKLFTKILYRKRRKVVECWYCGNKIPIE